MSLVLVSGQLLSTYDNSYRFGYDSLNDDFSGSSLGNLNSFSGFGGGLANIRDPRQNRGKIHKPNLRTYFVFFWRGFVFLILLSHDFIFNVYTKTENSHLTMEKWLDVDILCKANNNWSLYFDVPTS